MDRLYDHKMQMRNCKEVALITLTLLFVLIPKVESSSDQIFSAPASVDISVGRTNDEWQFSHRNRKEIITPDIPLNAPIVSNCQAFIEAYSHAAAEFTKCTIRNARPLKLCESCLQEYTRATAMYDSIMEEHTLDDTGETCRDIILNSDTIRIVVRTSDYVDALWRDCHCDGCYQFEKGENGSVIASLSNDTLHFSKLLNETLTCFEKYTKGFVPKHIKNGSYVNTTVCHKCGHDYDELNEFYNHLNEGHSHHVCMDIVDAMNRTRVLWSKYFKCRKDRGDIVAVLSLSVFFCLLPIIFYIGNKIYGTKVEQEILKQKRLRDVTSINST